MSNRLDSDQAQSPFGHHLGPICLQSLSADDTRVTEVISKAYITFCLLLSCHLIFFLNHFLRLSFHEYHQSFNKYLYHNLYSNFAEPDLVPNCLPKYSADDKLPLACRKLDNSRIVSHFNEFYFAVLA